MGDPGGVAMRHARVAGRVGSETEASQGWSGKGQGRAGWVGTVTKHATVVAKDEARMREGRSGMSWAFVG